MAKERNIVVCIILTIVTCGIYSLVWMAQMNDEARAEANDSEGTTGGMVVLFTIITCGIYQIYWFYKMGARMKNAGDNNNVAIEDRSTIYLVLGIAGFLVTGITYFVNMCLIQSDLNNLANSKTNI